MRQLPSDAELLDALEAAIKQDPLTLWMGFGDFPGGRTNGLSLIKGQRSLRQALAACYWSWRKGLEARAQKEGER